MATTIAPISELNIAEYGRMLALFAPKVIRTEGENQAALAIVESLLEKGEQNLSPEEQAMFDLVTTLIEQFEERAYPIPDAPPHEVLRDLMEHNGLASVDLAVEIGSRARVSEILTGKRSISKEQAKRLGARFGISAAAFI